MGFDCLVIDTKMKNGPECSQHAIRKAGCRTGGRSAEVWDVLKATQILGAKGPDLQWTQ